MLLIVVMTISGLAGMGTAARELFVVAMHVHYHFSPGGQLYFGHATFSTSVGHVVYYDVGRYVLWYKWRLLRGLAVGCFIVPRRVRLFERAVVVIVDRQYVQFQENPSLFHILPKSALRSGRSTELRSQH